MKPLTPDDSETKSADILAENVATLKMLIPEAFTEGKVDFEVLKQLLGGTVDERDEKYGLNWHGKRRARQIALTPSTGTLRPAPEDSVDWDTTQNLMIEGDNLEVLKLLQKSYAGKVKLIYIDPPYNTGKDFIYPDNYQDNIRNYLELTGQVDGDRRKLSSNTEASGRFHTDWLNMMYPRLKLAQTLLSEGGALFVSIDDAEVTNLRHLLDALFGPENFVGQVCVVSNPRGRQSEAIATTHEYLVCYARAAEHFLLRGQALSEDQLEDYKYLAPDGRKYRTRGLRHRGNASRRIDRPRMFFPLYVNPKSREVSMEPSTQFSVKVEPRKSSGEDGRWEWGPETARAKLSLLEGVLIDGRKEWDVFQKEFLEDGGGESRRAKWKSVWNEKEINYQNGKAELQLLFDPVPFEFPKPTFLLRKIIEGTTSGEDIVLDFFAGSGTTGHAVFESNRVDGHERRFALVQLPEPTRVRKEDGGWEESVAWKNGFHDIAAITKERLRRAAKRVREETPMFSGDLGFRVFKLASSNIRAWEPHRENLAKTLEENVDHLKTERTEQDILFELLLKLGLDLTVPIERKKIAGKEVHSIGAGTLLVCLSEKISAKEVEALALGIAEWHKALAPAGDTSCVFRDSAFADDVAKTNLTAILQQHGLGNVRSL